MLCTLIRLFNAAAAILLNILCKKYSSSRPTIARLLSRETNVCIFFYRFNAEQGPLLSSMDSILINDAVIDIDANVA